MGEPARSISYWQKMKESISCAKLVVYPARLPPIFCESYARPRPQYPLVAPATAPMAPRGIWGSAAPWRVLALRFSKKGAFSVQGLLLSLTLSEYTHTYIHTLHAPPWGEPVMHSRLNLRLLPLLAILILTIIPNLASLGVAEESSRLQIGQRVSGALSNSNTEDSYAINLPRGGYNVTLEVGSTADLGFNTTLWMQGMLTASLFGGWMSQDTGGPGVDEVFTLILPQASQLGLLPPGDYVIVVYGRVFGAYNLTVSQVRTYASLSLDTPRSFQASSPGWFDLFWYTAQTGDVYNFTVRSNSTSAAFFVAVYEDDIFLPAEFSIVYSALPYFLVPSGAGELYFQLLPGPGSPSGAVQGNVTISRTTMPSLTSGQRVQGTLNSNGEARYWAPLSVGSYHNFTLDVPSTADLRLELWSPSEPTFFPPQSSPSPAAWSNAPGNGADERITNFAIFQFSSYAVNGSGHFQKTFADGPFGASPGKVIVKVSGNPSASFNITLTSSLFPVLAPDNPRAVAVDSTTGPFYRFYRTSSQGAYNITFDYDVSGSSPGWASTISLVSPGSIPRTFQLNLIFQTWYLASFFTPQSYQRIAQSWVAESPSLSDSQSNQDGSSINRTLEIPSFAIPHPDPVYVGVVGSFSNGVSRYNGTLVYHLSSPVQASVGPLYTSRIDWPDTQIYRIDLVGGHPYRPPVDYTTADLMWAIYDSSGLLVPSQQSILWVFLTSDINYPDAGDEILIQPSASGTYYLATSITVNLGPQTVPSGTEGDYSFRITEVKPPMLGLTLSPPATAEIAQAYRVNGTVQNSGSTVAENVVVTLTLPSGTTSAQATTSNLGNLQPGETRPLSWTLTSQQPEPASLILEASASNVQSARVSGRVTVQSPTNCNWTDGFRTTGLQSLRCAKSSTIN